MFTPAELERVPVEISKLFRQLESDIMDDIVKRIAAIDEISRTADFEIYRLSKLGLSSDEIKLMIQDKLQLSDKEIDKIYDTVVKAGYARDENLYNAVGKPFIPFGENTELQQLIRAVEVQTKQELHNITQSMGFAVKLGNKTVFTPLSQHYQAILDRSMTQIMTGSFDFNRVLKETVKEMTNSGIRTVDYASGRSIRIEVAARRALMTGFAQITGKITEENARQLETDHFEISWHSTARPSHQKWQGRVYTKQELISVCGLGTAGGLHGANCYHDYYAFVPDVSVRMYTDEELDAMNAIENTPKMYNGKGYTAYEASQHQRKLERIMRAQREEIRLLELGGGGKEDITATKCRYRGTMAQYVDFSKAMSLPQQRERIYVDGLGRVG